MSGRAGRREQRLRVLLDELGFSRPTVTGWRERAACRGLDPELFFPVGTGAQAQEQATEAKHVCAECPVRKWCLADAMSCEDPALRWGVTGGLAAEERAELFAAQRRAVA